MQSPTLRTLPVWIIVALCVAFVLSSCRREPILTLPEGPQTVTGVLQSVPLSLKRRGTHVLLREGRQFTYLESTTVALPQYEGEEVTLEGTFEPNFDPHDLPVLVVRAMQDRSQMRGVFLPTVGLRLDVPQQWSIVRNGGGSSFTASGSTRPILMVARSALIFLPPGSPAIVGGERAVRLILPGGSDQVVYVSRGKDILTLAFTPGAAQALTAPALFLKILKSVRFDPSSPSLSPSSGTGSPLPHGQPCGGAAGILCPDGSYCAINDAQANAGFCAKR